MLGPLPVLDQMRDGSVHLVLSVRLADAVATAEAERKDLSAFRYHRWYVWVRTCIAAQGGGQCVDRRPGRTEETKRASEKASPASRYAVMYGVGGEKGVRDMDRVQDSVRCTLIWY